MAIIRICAAFSLGALGAPESEIVGAELTHGERFVCDGAALSGDHSGSYTFWGTVRQMPSASAYTCVYTRAGIATTLIIPVLARPTIQAPAAQATIARTTDLPLSFTPGQAGPTQVALNHM